VRREIVDTLYGAASLRGSAVSGGTAGLGRGSVLGAPVGRILAPPGSCSSSLQGAQQSLWVVSKSSDQILAPGELIFVVVSRV
jgi:hypothetical protein